MHRIQFLFKGFGFIVPRDPENEHSASFRVSFIERGPCEQIQRGSVQKMHNDARTQGYNMYISTILIYEIKTIKATLLSTIVYSLP